MEADCHGGRQRNPKGVVHRPSGSRDVGAHHWCVAECWEVQIACISLPLGRALPTVPIRCPLGSACHHYSLRLSNVEIHF